MNDEKIEKMSIIIGGKNIVLDDKNLKQIRIRIGTLLKTDNVSFLLGAGASIEAGGFSISKIPKLLEEKITNEKPEEEIDCIKLFYTTINGLVRKDYSIESRKREFENNDDNFEEIDINLEKYLNYLYIWLSGINDLGEKIEVCLNDSNLISINKNDLKELIGWIKYHYSCLLNLPTEDKLECLDMYKKFIKKMLTRPLNLKRANIFTLNNDTLIEQAADAEGVLLVDGFVGTIKRIFRPESYDIDFYFPAQTTEGKVHRFDRAFHLYKLHGSINWFRCEQDWGNPYGLYASIYNQECLKDDVIIYPSPLKYGEILGLPYSELFRRFGNAIIQPQSVLFTIGYGFGDEHVNTLLRQALSIPSFTLVIIDPKPKSVFLKKIKELKDERVWLITGTELGTFSNFVQKILPDLHEEEIDIRVIDTYKRLETVEMNKSNIEEENNVE